MNQFQCDYVAGCHPKVLEALSKTNLIEVPGYGEDDFCRSAADKIRTACALPEAGVYFMSGGTQTNLTVIGAVLRPHQGVVAADTAHIEAHETGAIEATGHKVLTIANDDGKVTAEALDSLCREYWQNEEKPLLVQPGMLYISFPTETGTLYSLAEIEALAEVCRRHKLFFYLDGARLAYGLAASEDVTMKDIARLTDAFYIGGTKCGTLVGEALVVKNTDLQRDFTAIMRQRGALLAKGRLIGVQYDALFTDGLYEAIGVQAIADARAIRTAFEKVGVKPAGSSPTNQQFMILTPAQMQILRRRHRFELCKTHADGSATVRFCSAWSTTRTALAELLEDIATL